MTTFIIGFIFGIIITYYMLRPSVRNKHFDCARKRLDKLFAGKPETDEKTTVVEIEVEKKD